MVNITAIIEAVIALIIALVTTFLIPWIKTKMNADKLAEVNKWVKVAVRAAEMIYTESGAGAMKKNYVLDFLSTKGLTYDSKSINTLIEAAVLDLKAEGAELK